MGHVKSITSVDFSGIIQMLTSSALLQYACIQWNVISLSYSNGYTSVSGTYIFAFYIVTFDHCEKFAYPMGYTLHLKYNFSHTICFFWYCNHYIPEQLYRYHGYWCHGCDYPGYARSLLPRQMISSANTIPVFRCDGKHKTYGNKYIKRLIFILSWAHNAEWKKENT